MKLVLSPAKSLNFESPLPTTQYTESGFLSKSERINKLLKSKSAKGLSKLMSISDALGALNHQRNQDWQLPFTTDNARPAVYAFNGDVYRGLDAYTIPEDKIEVLQNTVRILSGLYGLLKPLDLMQPYRLEMGTSFGVNGSKNLYQYWKEKLTKQLNAELDTDELVVNLASKEYALAVATEQLTADVIAPIFKDFKNGKLKIISFFAKKARGLMARYLIETNAKTTNDILRFALDGYAYSDEHTTNPTEPVFIR